MRLGDLSAGKPVISLDQMHVSCY